ncbi:hypothetical protein BN871_AO_00250 [Paenibacillus sp. P22]|nr:hypothetical protein BN871_AO_00250 [Paenibacillus sp. P22]
MYLIPGPKAQDSRATALLDCTLAMTMTSSDDINDKILLHDGQLA